LRTRVGLGNHVLDEGPHLPMGRGNFGGNEEPIVSIVTFSRERARTTEPIDFPFGLWTRVGQKKHRFIHIRQVAPLCPHGKAH